MRRNKQFTSILLSLLMILLPLAATSPSFLQEEIESEQYSDSFSGPTSGWGNRLRVQSLPRGARLGNDDDTWCR
ncbi:MAG: hypothetical protein Ct9H90mP16_07690 [Candidatus Poseidoniales archaeon]|nr:MAG: hypothetical protein Ct9H90mP16_07690 [Candidatus Poseidoniales archaeon]